MVSIPVCHTGDRGSIPRQRAHGTVLSIQVCHNEDRGSIPRQTELLQSNTRIQQVTESSFDLNKRSVQKRKSKR